MERDRRKVVVVMGGNRGYDGMLLEFERPDGTPRASPSGGFGVARLHAWLLVS